VGSLTKSHSQKLIGRKPLLYQDAQITYRTWKERPPSPIQYHERNYTLVTTTRSKSTTRSGRRHRTRSQSTSNRQGTIERIEECLHQVEMENAQLRAAQDLQNNQVIVVAPLPLVDYSEGSTEYASDLQTETLQDMSVSKTIRT
jgi:hypothetical protein